MTTLGSGPISFSTLKTRYVADGDDDANGNSNLQGKSARCGRSSPEKSLPGILALFLEYSLAKSGKEAFLTNALSPILSVH